MDSGKRRESVAAKQQVSILIRFVMHRDPC